MIPEIMQKEIKRLIRQGKEKELSRYIDSLIWSWDLDGFASKSECELAYRRYATSIRIRQYLRSHSLTTRKGSYHSFNCQVEHFKLWDIIANGTTGQDCESTGVRWEYRRVDQLRNVRVWFE